MQQGYAAVLCVLAVLGLEAAAPGECELTRLLQDKLQYEMRLRYMKHYFPINYTVQVQYEEVLRPSNITRLRNGTVSEAALRYLWFHVSSQAVLRIREVLPERHPSWKYTQELCQLFDALGKEYSKYRQVGGSPPNTAEDPLLDAFSLPWSLGCCLCSAPPPQQSLLGGVPKEGATGGQMPPSPGPNTLPLQDPGTFHSHRVSPIRNARHLLHGCGLGGAWTQPPPMGKPLLAAGRGRHAALPAAGVRASLGSSWFVFFPQLSLNTS
ncbi:interleukin-34 isoform X1 [Harpia harpyja]|uniref:interleukin-34 isoform X1 n=1 Tax=Harpia harpyja TaxID=202280 RepID=UPI0022B0D760|nr:interleukin-34 isoform X1 [Harpia harpyja]XP_052653521.1 interleukin-34 isoform X1 [Harpia harpyja]XP_052653522.1 interleukin-34 isoform X1 [Harpia harpyja]